MMIHNKKKIISFSLILITIILSILVLANQQINEDYEECVMTDTELELRGCGFAPCSGDDGRGGFCFCAPFEETITCSRKIDRLCVQGIPKEGEPNFPTKLVYDTQNIESLSFLNYDFMVLGDENHTSYKLLYGLEHEEYKELDVINLKDEVDINIGTARVIYFFETNDEEFILNFVIFDFYNDNKVGYKTLSYVYKHLPETKEFEKTNTHNSGDYEDFLRRSDRNSISDYTARQVIPGMYEHNTAFISVRKDEAETQKYRLIKLEFEKDENELKHSAATISNEFELNRIEHELLQEETQLRDDMLNVVNQKVSTKEDFIEEIMTKLESSDFFKDINLTVLVNVVTEDQEYVNLLSNSAQNHENLELVFNTQGTIEVFFNKPYYKVPNIFYYIHQNSDQVYDYTPHIFILKNTTQHKPFHEQHKNIEIYSTSADSFNNLNFEKREQSEWAMFLFLELFGIPRNDVSTGFKTLQLLAVFGKQNVYNTDLWLETTQSNDAEKIYLLQMNKEENSNKFEIQKLSTDLNLENYNEENMPDFYLDKVIYEGLDEEYHKNFHLSKILLTYFFESDERELTSCFVEHEGEIIIDRCKEMGGEWHKTNYYDKSRPGYQILYGTKSHYFFDLLGEDKNIADEVFIHNEYECLIDTSEQDRCGGEMEPMCAWGCKDDLSPCGFGICMQACKRGENYSQFTLNSETGKYEISTNEDVAEVTPAEENAEVEEGIQGSDNLVIMDIRVTKKMGLNDPVSKPSEVDPNHVKIEELNDGYFFNVLIRGATCGQDNVDLKLFLYQNNKKIKEIGSAKYNNNIFSPRRTEYLKFDTAISACASSRTGQEYDLNYRFNLNNYNAWTSLPEGNYQLKVEVSRTGVSATTSRFWWQGRGILSRGNAPIQENQPIPEAGTTEDDATQEEQETQTENIPGYGEGDARGPFILGGCDALANGHKTILFKNPYGADACLLNKILPKGAYNPQSFDEIDECIHPTISQLRLLYGKEGICKYFPNEPICNIPTEDELLIWSKSCKIIAPLSSPSISSDLSGCEVLDITKSGGVVPIQGRAVTRFIPMHISRKPHSLCVINTGVSSNSNNDLFDFFTPAEGSESTESAESSGDDAGSESSEDTSQEMQSAREICGSNTYIYVFDDLCWSQPLSLTPGQALSTCPARDGRIPKTRELQKLFNHAFRDQETVPLDITANKYYLSYRYNPPKTFFKIKFDTASDGTRYANIRDDSSERVPVLCVKEPPSQTQETQETQSPDDPDDPSQSVYPDGNIIMLKTTDTTMIEQGFNTVCIYFNEQVNKWRYVSGYTEGQKICPIREQGSSVGLVDSIIQSRGLGIMNYEEGLEIICDELYEPGNMITREVEIVERLAPCN